MATRGSRAGFPFVVVLLIGVVGLGVIPLGSAAASPAPAVHPSVTVTSTVTWNGVNVDTASGVSSALSIGLSSPANLLYNWSESASAGSPITVTDARLQMYYFGYAVASRDITLSNPAPSRGGAIALNWTPIAVNYVLGGVYRLTASLLVANGSTVWSENFYVRGNAPAGILAALPIILLLIAIYEVYLLVRSGRYAALDRKPPTPANPPQAGGSPPPPAAPPVPPSEGAP